jgi:hypothetical protein
MSPNFELLIVRSSTARHLVPLRQQGGRSEVFEQCRWQLGFAPLRRSRRVRRCVPRYRAGTKGPLGSSEEHERDPVFEAVDRNRTEARSST